MRIAAGTQCLSFFEGLLPDDQNIRKKIAMRDHAESTSVFDLLGAIGRDCVGALRFIPEGQDPGNPTEMIYRSLSHKEIAKRIAFLGKSPLGIQYDEDFRISIAGVQEKTAFLWIDNHWQLPLHHTPTSHIFKPPIKEGPNGANFSDTPWNEWLCLNICHAFGLETVKAKVTFFDDKPVLVIERFDRQWQEHILYRLPQEDFCQALGVSPTRKYQSDGGPSIIDGLHLLQGAMNPKEDSLKFIKAHIVFYLVAAIDGHAKNFSLFISPGGFRLTPLYDVLSAAPYPELSPHKIKLAMAFGNKSHYRLKGIMPRHFYQTAQKGGLHREDRDNILSELMKQVDHVIEKIAKLAVQFSVPTKTFWPILEGIKKRAKTWVAS